MKKIILTLAVALSVTVNAQKKEVQSALKSLESKNLSQASNQMTAAEKLVQANSNKIEDKTYLDFLLTKAKVNLELAKNSQDSKNLDLAVASLTEILNFEKGTTYAVKNKDTGEKYFFSSESEMKKAVSNGKWSKPKAKKRTELYTNEAKVLLNDLNNTIITKANTAYNAKDYKTAAKLFEQLASSANDDAFLHSSAVSSQLAEDFSEASKKYEALMNKGYTGVKTIYYATEVATGQERSFGDNKDYRKQQIGLSLFRTPREETTKDITKSMYDAVIYIAMKEQKYDKAISFIQEGIQKFPTENSYKSQLAEAYRLSGNSDQFIKQLEANLETNPNDATSLFNLGVLYNQKGETQKAISFYDKSIAVNPENVGTYINVAALFLSGEQKIVDEINSLGTSRKDISKANALAAKRAKMYGKALPYLEKAIAIEPNNQAVLQALSAAYRIMDNTQKYKETKAKLKSLR